jgi:ribosome-associated protein
MRDLDLGHGILVPAQLLRAETSRSGGPGGQNVNKVATKIDLRVDLDAIEGLSDGARARLRALAAHRLDAAGRLVMTSQAGRNQAGNLEDAREKVRRLVRAALVRPRARVATRAPAGADERRLDVKRRRGALKRWRVRPGGED